MPFFLNPLKAEKILEKYLDQNAQKAFKLLVKTIIFPQILQNKFNSNTNRSIIYPLEFIEEHLASVFNAKQIGEGSYPVDLKIENEFLDIKVVQAKLTQSGNLSNSESGESSLGQKFTNFGDFSLDTLFDNKRYNEICECWKNILKNKYKAVFNDHGNQPISYMFVIKCGNYFLISVLNLNIEYINLISADIARTRNSRTTKSVFLNNFIDERFGNAKIYKSKKRLELRLRPKYLLENGFAVKLNTNFVKSNLNIKQLATEINEKEILDLLYHEMLQIEIEFEKPTTNNILF